MSSWNQRIAIFGGAFDPPHLGHLEAAKGLLSSPGVRQVWVMPSAASAYRAHAVSSEHRLKMCQIQFKQQSEIRVDAREIERYQRTQQPTYTYDTLLELKSEGVPSAFVIGADQLQKLHTWYRFPEFMPLTHWIILARKPQGEAVIQQVLSQWKNNGLTLNQTELTWVHTPAPEVSSTMIRESFARGANTNSGFLHKEVETYLKENRLYGTQQGNDD